MTDLLSKEEREFYATLPEHLGKVRIARLVDLVDSLVRERDEATDSGHAAVIAAEQGEYSALEKLAAANDLLSRVPRSTMCHAVYQRDILKLQDDIATHLAGQPAAPSHTEAAEAERQSLLAQLDNLIPDAVARTEAEQAVLYAWARTNKESLRVHVSAGVEPTASQAQAELTHRGLK